VESIPTVVTRHGSKESTGYRDKLSVRCRHAARLLQRSPYCPMVTAAKQANAELQRHYDEMEELLNQAALGKKDLGIQDGEGVQMFRPSRDMPNRPYRKMWTEKGDNTTTGMSEGGILHEPVKPEEKNWGEWGEWGEWDKLSAASSYKYQNLEDKSLRGEDEDEELGKAAGGRAINYVRRVRAGEVVQLFPKM